VYLIAQLRPRHSLANLACVWHEGWQPVAKASEYDNVLLILINNFDNIISTMSV
jgi:hypothetical protein